MDRTCDIGAAAPYFTTQVSPNAPTSMAARTRLAKLTRPATAATYSRTRLFEELDKADAAPVVWVVGPPGSGKTTLIADYTATRRLGSLVPGGPGRCRHRLLLLLSRAGSAGRAAR